MKSQPLTGPTDHAAVDITRRDGGRSWTHVFDGASRGDTVSGKWMDNRTRGGGDLSVLMIDGKRLEKAPGTGQGFGGSTGMREPRNAFATARRASAPRLLRPARPVSRKTRARSCA
jgi:hypothetical protein